MEKETGSLQVRMLGGFSLTYRGRELQEGNMGTKVCRLLQMLLEAGPEGLAIDEILDDLFPQVHTPEEETTLRVTVCSLRKLLRKWGLPDEKYIYLRKWRYRLEASFPVETDTGRLREARERLRGRGGLMEPPEGWETLYGGPFLPALGEDAWAERKRAFYQEAYRECLEGFFQAWKEKGEWGRLEGLCGHAASFYPLDVWQRRRLQCLLRLGRHGDTLGAYREMERAYLGRGILALPEAAREELGRAGELVEMGPGSLEGIREELERELEPEGACQCGYPAFLDCCRVAARLMGVTGESIYLVLCTLKDSHKNIRTGSEGLREMGDRLAEVIRKDLGREVMFARYSADQYLLLLPRVCREECPAVVRRLEEGLLRQENRRKYRLTGCEMSLGMLRFEEIGMIS